MDLKIIITITIIVIKVIVIAIRVIGIVLELAVWAKVIVGYFSFLNCYYFIILWPLLLLINFQYCFHYYNYYLC